jgi:hypothetical protein
VDLIVIGQIQPPTAFDRWQPDNIPPSTEPTGWSWKNANYQTMIDPLPAGLVYPGRSHRCPDRKSGWFQAKLILYKTCYASKLDAIVMLHH